MSTTSQPTDFQDLYLDLQNRVRVETGLAATENQAKRYINTALIDLHIGFGEKFWWAHRDTVIRTQPAYTTGTADVTIGSTTVSGNSTLWDTANDYSIKNVRAGGKIKFGDGNIYEVSSVASDTSLTLTYAYNGATDTTVSYTYFEDEYTLASDFLRPVDMRRFSSPADITMISPEEFKRAFPRNDTIGDPTIATIIGKLTGTDTSFNRRVRFYRPPSTAKLIPYTYITANLVLASDGTEQTSFSADADEPIVPLNFRHAIILHALYNWYRDKKDDQRSVEVKSEYVDLMSRVVGDTEVGIEPRPRIQPRISGYRARASRPWRGGQGGRYVTGSRFDEVR